MRHAEELGVRLRPVGEVSLELLASESELELLRKINELPREVQSGAGLRAPYRLTHYVEDVAGPRLIILHRAIKPQSERYIRLYVTALLDQIATSVREHERIAVCIAKGD